jgi:hypothetical protein
MSVLLRDAHSRNRVLLVEVFVGGLALLGLRRSVHPEMLERLP